MLMLNCRFNLKRAVCVVAIAGGLVVSPAQAQGNKGGGGGGTAAYTIIDLPGSYHELNGGSSQTGAGRIADAGTDGFVYILGAYRIGTGDEPCVWTVSPDGTVAVTDLAGQIDNYQTDINSAGIIAGERGFRPLLLLADGTTVFLADESVSGRLYGVNNPDANGVFQVVGYLSGTASNFMLWNDDLDGNTLSESVLEDAAGLSLLATDVSDSLFLGGSVQGTPAVGAFDGNGQLQIGLLSFPDGIDGSYDYQINDACNLLAFGYQSADPYGYYARAVIWPAAGGVIDVTAETGVADTEGNGIALVGDSMQVVGRAHNSRGESFAYLFTGGSLMDLVQMSKGDQSWKLQRAEGVNTSGMICGQGRVGSKRNFQVHGYVLTPNIQ